MNVLVVDIGGTHVKILATRQDKPKSLADLNLALEAWTTRIQSLTAQVKLLLH